MGIDYDTAARKAQRLISGGPWSPKSLMDMEPVIELIECKTATIQQQVRSANRLFRRNLLAISSRLLFTLYSEHMFQLHGHKTQA